MRYANALALLLCLVVVIHAVRGGDGAAQKGVIIEHKDVLWTESCLEILGRGAHSSDVAGALVRLLGAFRNEPLRTEAAADALVRAVDGGFDAKKLIIKLQGAIRIDDETGSRNQPAGWEYGTLANRVDLTGYLSVREAKLSQTDPSLSRQYARAIFLLAMLENDVSGPIYSIGPTGNKAREEMGLTQNQADRLTTLASDFRASTEANQMALLPVRARLIDLAGAPPGNFSDERITNALNAVMRARRLVMGQPWNIRLMHYLWQMLNIARDRKDARSIALIEGAVKQWARDVDGTPAACWILEALDTRAPGIHPPAKR